MSFNKKNYYELKEQFLQKHLAAADKAEARKRELALKIEGLEEVDTVLAATAARIFAAALGGKDGLDERIAAIKKETDELRAARDELLKANGYPKDYTDVHYECEKCKDLGFEDTKMCECFRRALVMKGYETSGLGALIGKQTFDNYSLAFFRYEKDVYTRMSQVFEIVRDYAENFSLKSGSLLFMGGTGLGKTHLSSAVAKTAIDRGYDVLYTSAVNMVGDFENAKFYKDEADVSKYFDAELLILDDLGTEASNSITNSFIYNVIDTRICKGLPTIVSTNLGQRDIATRYGERVFSRLFGVYRPLLFCGRDVRFEKK
ncbi:MAG: ATP-binding protein [Clostridia bacterium]|nr:ATP-binding protein [Clostridia bacterium]